MKKRNPAAVLLLPFVTLGIYQLVWQVKTKNEMNSLGNNIPTAWLVIVPFVGYYWLYKYSEGVDQVTGGNASTLMAFVLLFLLGPIGAAIIQSEFNKVADGQVPAAAGQPLAPSMPTGQPLPDNSFGGPAATMPAAPAPVPAPYPPVAPSAPAPVATPAPGMPYPPTEPVAPTQPPQNLPQ